MNTPIRPAWKRERKLTDRGPSWRPTEELKAVSKLLGSLPRARRKVP